MSHEPSLDTSVLTRQKRAKSRTKVPLDNRDRGSSQRPAGVTAHASCARARVPGTLESSRWNGILGVP